MKKFLVLSLILLSAVFVKGTFASDYHNEDYIKQCGGSVDWEKRNDDKKYDYTDALGRDFDTDGHQMW